MQKKVRQVFSRPTSTYLKWFVSYVLVLILPFGFGCGLYAYALEAVQAEMDEIQDVSISRTKTLVENTVMDAANISEALLCNENVMRLADLPEEAAAYSEAGLVNEIAKTVRHYEASSQLISAIYVCMAEKRYVISQSAYYRYEWFRSSAEDFLGLSYKDFLLLTEEENSNHFLLAGEGTGCTAFYAHSSYRYDGGEKAPVVILIRYNDKLFANLLAAENYLTCLYQPEGRFLLSDSLWAEDAGELLGRALSGDGGGYYLRAEPIGSRQMQIVNLMDKQLYFGQMNRMKDLLFLYVLLCLLLGGALAWYLAHRNYSPVRELAAMATRVSGGQGSQDDFSCIKASMERLVKDFAEHRNLAREKERQATEALLARFLQGKCFGGRELSEAYGLLGQIFGGGEMLILAYEAELDEEESTRAADKEQLAGGRVTLESLELPYFVLKNITEELLGDRFQSFTLECAGLTACLVGTAGKTGALAEIAGIADRVCNYAKEYFHYTIVADISSIHETAAGLPAAFEEIAELISFRDFVGTPLPVITYPDFRKEQVGEGVEEYRRAQCVNRLIRQHDYREAARLLVSYAGEDAGINPDTGAGAESFEAGAASSPGGGCLGAGLGNGAGEPCGGADASPGQAPPREAAGKEQSRFQPEELMREAAAYLEGHYTDKNLTAGFLADQMGMGLSNLSQMFKRYQGCGLLEYINQLRLGKAKEYLREGKTVKETADLVGFYTTRPLTNLFNQIEGMTPVAWKNKELAGGDREREKEEKN